MRLQDDGVARQQRQQRLEVQRGDRVGRGRQRQDHPGRAGEFHHPACRVRASGATKSSPRIDVEHPARSRARSSAACAPTTPKPVSRTAAFGIGLRPGMTGIGHRLGACAGWWRGPDRQRRRPPSGRAPSSRRRVPARRSGRAFQHVHRVYDLPFPAISVADARRSRRRSVRSPPRTRPGSSARPA